MKAICIDNETEEHKNFKAIPTKEKLKGLTKDKEYEVKQSKEYEGYFEVMNDLNEIETYKKYRFEVIEDKKVVKCIESDGHYLNVDEEYIVEGEKWGYYNIKIDGIDRAFKKIRFEVVEGEKMQGDVLKIRCIKDGGLTDQLTIGKEYKAV